MASPDHDAWKQRLAQRYANIQLNLIEEVNLKYHAIVYILSFLQVLVKVTFHRHFKVCLDSKKQLSLEDIRQWFNGMLVGCGQKPWRKPGKNGQLPSQDLISMSPSGKEEKNLYQLKLNKHFETLYTYYVVCKELHFLHKFIS